MATATDFRSLFSSVSKRPGMYMPATCGYFGTAAFVCGCDAATGDELLAGLNEWLSERHGTPANVVWWGQLLIRRFPGHDARQPWRLDEDDEAAAIGELWTTLDDFLRERTSSA
jgi:hypothetical protein